MSELEAATFRADLRKLAAEIGPKLEACRTGGHISAGCHLVMAREAIFAALHSFNPTIDERELNLALEIEEKSRGAAAVTSQHMRAREK